MPPSFPSRRKGKAMPLQNKRGRAGLVMLEYILLAALVAIACIGSFYAYGDAIRDVISHVLPDSSGALEKP